MSITVLQDEINKIIKPQLEEILSMLKNQQNSSNNRDIIEAVAAKIINEIKAEIHKCDCSKQILDAIQTGTAKEKKIICQDDVPETNYGPWKYSYPNFNVGNEEMGTGKNPKSLTWPFHNSQ